jgi:hypothetical protein
MKVAIVGPAYLFRGGIAHYTMLLTAHLSAQHETRLYIIERQYPAGLVSEAQPDRSLAPIAPLDARRWLTPWWPISWRRVTQEWRTWQSDRVVIQWWVPFMAPTTFAMLTQSWRDAVRCVCRCVGLRLG